MLRQYLTTAQEDLENKKELAAIKEARLNLAQDEYRHLNSTLTSIHASNTSYIHPPLPSSSALSASTISSPNTTIDLPDYCNLQQIIGGGHHYANTQQQPLMSSPIPPRPPSAASAAGAVILGGNIGGGSEHLLRRTGSIHENELYANSRYAASLTNGGGVGGGKAGAANKTGSSLSLNSTTSSTSTKYDPDLLKADVAHAKARVNRLRRELANIHSEVEYKSKGVETLNNVNNKFELGRGLTPEEALAIRSELHNIQQSLVTGEQEKVQLMKKLACLKEDLTRLEVTDASMDVPPISQAETLSIASQTDLTGEEMVPVGARLAELARLRLQYDESRRNVQELQQRLSSLEERISPGQLESDNDRLLLIQEKEQLLRELRSINSRNKNKRNPEDLRQEIRKLETDLNQATETSNKCIAERLKTHEEKQYLLQQLKVSMKSVTSLESQLRLLSASTLSMSSSSSLGSLGSSSHASSKGSLSSLSFTDIYGMSTTTAPDPNMLDLQRRVEKILLGSNTNSSASNNNNNTATNTSSSANVSSSTGNISNSHLLTNSNNSNAITNSSTSIMAGLMMNNNMMGVGGGGGRSTSSNSRNQSTEELRGGSGAHGLVLGGGVGGGDQNLTVIGHSGVVGGVNHQLAAASNNMMLHGNMANARKASSQLSLSPRSSLSSVSPPVSPYNNDPTSATAGMSATAAATTTNTGSALLPSYEQAYLGSQERQRRLNNLSLSVTGSQGGGAGFSVQTNSPAGFSLLGSPGFPGGASAAMYHQHLQATTPPTSNSLSSISSQAHYQQDISPVDSESSGKKSSLAATPSSGLPSPLKRSLGAIAGGGNLKPLQQQIASSNNSRDHLELTDLASNLINNGGGGGNMSQYGVGNISAVYAAARRTTSASGQESVSSDQSAPLSPISESAILSDSIIGGGGSSSSTSGVGGANSRLGSASGGGLPHPTSSGFSSSSRSVSAAVSDESVAGDSGVFEAASSTTRGGVGGSKEDLLIGGGGGSGSLQSMNLETAQIQIKLRYSTPDGLLHIGIEKARNLSVLFIPEGKKVCIKAALLPAIANVSYTFCTRALSNLNKPNFGENFPVAISKPKLVTKTLQVNVWAIDPSPPPQPQGGGGDTCLGSAQVSLADFNCGSVSLRWYNVLSFHFMQPEVASRRSTTTSGGANSTSSNNHGVGGSSRPTSLHAKQESEVSMASGSRVGTLKEESSDESTIISSQTSTLTRNIGPEAMHHQEDVTFYPLEVEYEDDEDECEDEDSPPHHHQYGGRAPPATVYADRRAPLGKEHVGRAPTTEQAPPVAVSLHEEDGGSQYTNPGSEEEIKVDISENYNYPASSTCPSSSGAIEKNKLQHNKLQQEEHESVDKETNTDCVYIQPPVIKGRLELGAFKGAPTSSIVKRSKTFSPTAPINKSQYSCRLNRSDSDSAMPLYRRLPFQRTSRERRSLGGSMTASMSSAAGSAAAGYHPGGIGGGAHGAKSSRRSHSGVLSGMAATAGLPKRNQTSLDLELDLAAQNSRLQVLKDEIGRLRRIKEELERVKEKGDKDLPAWIGEDTLFIKLLQNLEGSSREKSTEEKKMEKLLRRTAKEIYKLRKTKNRTGQLDAQSFREKMAFLTNVKSSVPILEQESDDNYDDDDEDDDTEGENDDDLSVQSSYYCSSSSPLHQHPSSSTTSFPPHHHLPEAGITGVGGDFPTAAAACHNQSSSGCSSPMSTSFTTMTPTPTPQQSISTAGAGARSAAGMGSSINTSSSPTLTCEDYDIDDVVNSSSCTSNSGQFPSTTTTNLLPSSSAHNTTTNNNISKSSVSINTTSTAVDSNSSSHHLRFSTETVDTLIEEDAAAAVITSNDNSSSCSRRDDDVVVVTPPPRHVSRVDVTTTSSSSSQHSTPTLAPRHGAPSDEDGGSRKKQVERFVYEVDPELGAFV